VGFINIYGLSKKCKVVEELIKSKQLYVFATCETYHRKQNDASILNATPVDYKAIERARKSNIKTKGGGIAVFCHSRFSCQRIPTITMHHLRKLVRENQSQECSCRPNHPHCIPPARWTTDMLLLQGICYCYSKTERQTRVH